MGEPAVVIAEEEATEVAISGAMTIDRIGELRGLLLEAFSLGKRVHISLAGVTEVDITGLQLLCSAHRTSLAKGVEFSVSGGEGKILSLMAKQAGMLRHVGCPEDICGTCVWKDER